MHFKNPKWGHRVIRAFGALNILFAAVGVYAVSGTAVSVFARLQDSADQPYVREAYYIMTLVDLACLLALTVGGTYLWRLSRRGLVISNVVFVTEIAWFIGNVALALALGMSGGRWGLLGGSIAAAGGIGAMGTAPQIITAYPVWALVALNLVCGSFPNHALHSG
ncbi:MAG: hypothetical protein ABSF14_20560 [Terriglobia bacterium]|jgi:hypothetical protein